MSPLTVTLQVPYTENEQQFLLQAVEAAVRTFRSLKWEIRRWFWGSVSDENRSRRADITVSPGFLEMLPRCYQDRTTQSHLPQCQEHPGLWFLVGLGCLRLGYREFVNRRSSIQSGSPAPLFQAFVAYSWCNKVESAI
jgi:hypothetical protein